MKNNHDPEFNSAGILFIAQLIHVFLVISILGHYLDFKIIKFSQNSILNKLAFFPFGIAWLAIIHLYFKKKHNRLKSSLKKEELTNYQFVLLLIIVIIVPLYFLIKVTGGQVWK